MNTQFYTSLLNVILDGAFTRNLVRMLIAKGQTNNFSSAEYDRVVWGLPAAYYGLILTSLVDHGLEGSEESLKQVYLSQCFSRFPESVLIGERILAPMEREYLHRLDVFGSGIFRSIESRTAKSGELLGAISLYRIRAIEKMILTAKYPLGVEISIVTPSLSIDQKSDEIYMALGYLVSVAATGYDRPYNDVGNEFVACILSFAMNQIDDEIIKIKESYV